MRIEEHESRIDGSYFASAALGYEGQVEGLGDQGIGDWNDGKPTY
jgi:hypothetical protein